MKRINYSLLAAAGTFDLIVRFDRAALIELLDHTTGDTAIVHATWRYDDGAEGDNSVQVRVLTTQREERVGTKSQHSQVSDLANKRR